MEKTQGGPPRSRRRRSSSSEASRSVLVDKVLSVLALASSLDQPPSPPSRRCCRMPMSCLVTEAIFPNISENAFAMRFSCLQDTFFTFFFLPGTEITSFTSASTTRTTRREPMLSFRSASRAGLRALLSTRTSPGAAGYGKRTIPFQHRTSPSSSCNSLTLTPRVLSS